MSVLISGIHGFLGRHIAASHVHKAQKISGIDRELLQSPEGLTEYVEYMNPEYIYHFASYGNHSHQTERDQIFKSNIVATHNLLEASRNVDYKAFINVSSSIVEQPVHTMYASSKRCGEELVKSFVEDTGKPVVSIRPASVFGEGEADFRFIPTVIKHLKNGRRMPLDPSPRHSWIYVGDFVKATELIASKAQYLKGKAINISWGREWTNADIVECLEEISGKKLNFDIVESMRSYDKDHWLVDTTELTRLGFEYTFTLREALELTHYFYEQRLKEKHH